MTVLQPKGNARRLCRQWLFGLIWIATDCAIDEHHMVIGVGITYRSLVLTPYET